MKRYLTALGMCQSMFCAIPCPFKAWDEDSRPLMLLFLPVIGLEIGLIWAGLAYLARVLELHTLVTGVILCAFPFVATGFIHLDGFMDVTDAVKSWRDLERRREILKDSHVGSFSVIGVALLMLCQFSFIAAAPEDANCLILIFIPAVTRCCSALAITLLKPMGTSQYAAQKDGMADPKVVYIMLAVFIAAGFLFCGRYGFCSLGAVLGYGLALRRGYKSLDGMNGDISGYAITVGEVCALAVYALI